MSSRTKPAVLNPQLERNQLRCNKSVDPDKLDMIELDYIQSSLVSA